VRQVVGDGQDTHGAAQLNALLGHDPDTWKHSVRADPTVDSSSSGPTRASRSEGQTDEPTRTVTIID
jgi:hypothetical protein